MVLGLTSDSLSIDHSLSPEALCFAASIGGAFFHPKPAMDLARSFAAPEPLWQLTLHHGLLDPVIKAASLPVTLTEELLSRSPLTAVLHLPLEGGEDAALCLCERLASTTETRRLLVRRFAEPGINAGQLSWRGRIMAALRLSERYRPFVLDIYETAVALHGHAWRHRIRQATCFLALEQPTEQEHRLALSVARWWHPLLTIHSAHHQGIRERNYLEFHTYLEGIRLAATVSRSSKGIH